jgi:hypothetical protein
MIDGHGQGVVFIRVMKTRTESGSFKESQERDGVTRKCWLQPLNVQEQILQDTRDFTADHKLYLKSHPGELSVGDIAEVDDVEYTVRSGAFDHAGVGRLFHVLLEST